MMTGMLLALHLVDWSEVVGMFKRVYPTLHAVELSAPFVIIRLAELPPTPWPFTIGGLPLRFTDTDHGGHSNPGILGRGTHELNSINLRRGDILSDHVVQQALAVMQTREVKVHQIFCFDNYWSIVIPDGTDLKSVPRGLAGQAHLRRYDILDMKNPYTGCAEGTVIGVGLKLATEGETEFIRHTWNIFENGIKRLDGSCGCPILDRQGSVVGLFGSKIRGDEGCLAISATELRRFGYKICGGEQRF